MADLIELSSFIHQHLSSGPKPWLRIRGLQAPCSPPQKSSVPVDFDIKIDCSERSMLFEAELENMSGEGDGRHKIDVSFCQSDEDAVELVARECERIARESDLQGLSIHKLVTDYNYSLPLLISAVNSIASEILYTGYLEVTLHDYFVPEIANIGAAESGDHGAILEAGWAFEWPPMINARDVDSKKRDVSWRQRIQYAMLEKEHGWVALDRFVPDGAFVFVENGGVVREVGLGLRV